MSLILIVIVMFQFHAMQSQSKKVPDFSYEKFYAAVENKEVKNVTFNEQTGQISGEN